MIKEFARAWEVNNKKLLRYWNGKEVSFYEDIVKPLITIVINPYLKEHTAEHIGLDVDNITIIDDGDYQGSQIFIFPKDTYQPDTSDYYFTYADYGSCSCCDTLERINSFERGLERDKEYNTLALHLLQRFRLLNERRTEDEVYTD